MKRSGADREGPDPLSDTEHRSAWAYSTQQLPLERNVEEIESLPAWADVRPERGSQL